ncbi:MAG: hypothetical protein AAGI38_21865 [Bacteroidota bacterium]
MRVYPIPVLILFVCGVLVPGAASGQLSDLIDEDESDLYAATKQVNQFFRRFNGEEGPDGLRYYDGEDYYRDDKQRLKYLHILFDEQNDYLTDKLRDAFISDVSTAGKEVYLDFHGGGWVAEIQLLADYKGEEREFTLFLKIQEEEVGSKWVITHVYSDYFARQLVDTKKPDPDEQVYLHPLSHELGFSNINRMWNNKEAISQYISQVEKNNHLTLFLWEIKQGNLDYISVLSTRFHFFQVEDWYFEVKYFNREGYNKGWLISSLSRLSNKEKQQLADYLYYK